MSRDGPTDEEYTVSVIQALRSQLASPGKLSLAEYLRARQQLERELRRLDRLQRKAAE